MRCFKRLRVERALVKRECRIDVAVLPEEQSSFQGPLGGRADEQEQAAGIVQANLRESKIVNAETEGRADVASIAADYPSYALVRSASMLQCIFKLLKLGIGKDETSVGLFFAREWLEILDFDAGGVRIHGP